MPRWKANPIVLGVWLALLLALIGSLRHVAWAFSTLEGGDMGAGYVQAVAVDLGLVALALGIQQRRRQRRKTTTLWIGVGLFSGISTYANLLFGLVHEQAVLAGRLADLRPVLMSAVLPMLVLYLSEIAGSDVNYTAQVLEREERRRARMASNTGKEDVNHVQTASVLAESAEHARAALAEQRQRSKLEALDAMLDIWRENPETRVVDVARRIGRSRTTVYTYLGELERSHRLSRENGTVKVLEEVQCGDE